VFKSIELFYFSPNLEGNVTSLYRRFHFYSDSLGPSIRILFYMFKFVVQILLLLLLSVTAYSTHSQLPRYLEPVPQPQDFP